MPPARGLASKPPSTPAPAAKCHRGQQAETETSAALMHPPPPVSALRRSRRLHAPCPKQGRSLSAPGPQHGQPPRHCPGCWRASAGMASGVVQQNTCASCDVGPGQQAARRHSRPARRGQVRRRLAWVLALGMHGREACMGGGFAPAGGMYGRGACMGRQAFIRRLEGAMRRDVGPAWQRRAGHLAPATHCQVSRLSAAQGAESPPELWWPDCDVECIRQHPHLRDARC